MTKSAELDIAVQRNEDFGPFEFGLVSGDDLLPVDVENWTFTLCVDYAPGRTATPVLKITSIPNGNGSFVSVVDHLAGTFQIGISRVDIQAIPGDPADTVGLFHNLIASDELGYERVIARGKFIVEAGV